MPFGTPSRVNVTVVESDDCSSVMVSVASCSMHAKFKYSNSIIVGTGEGGINTWRPRWTLNRPSLLDFLAGRDGDIFAFDTSTEEGIRRTRLGS